MARVFSLAKMAQGIILGIIAAATKDVRKDQLQVVSFTSKELLPKVRAGMRDTINMLVQHGMLDPEFQAQLTGRAAEDPTLAIIDEQFIGATLQQLGADEPAEDADGNKVVSKDGEVVRIPGTAKLVRDPFSDFTGRPGNTGWTTPEEFMRAKEARMDTFPDVEDSLRAADFAYQRARAAAETDRWNALQLARRQGVQGEPLQWLALMEEEDGDGIETEQEEAPEVSEA